MASSTEQLPPPFEYDTIIKNIAQANGNEIINNIDEFLSQQGITLGFDSGTKEAATIDNATLLERLSANNSDPHQTRQLVRSYFDNVDRMQGLETESTKALKDVEKAQVVLENIIQDLENQRNSL